MKKLITKSVVYAVALAAVFGMASHAFASGVIDPDPSPSHTGITTAAIAPTNVIGISKTASAQPGDVVAVNVYYHNSGNQTINNLTIRISPSQTGPSTTNTFTGTISGDGVTSVSDNATVNVSSSQTLTFIPGSVQYFPNQTTTPQSISPAQEAQLVGGSGLNIGALTAGWSSQGGIQAFFQVSSGGGITCPQGQHIENGVCVPDTVNGQAPTVSTSNYSGYDAANGNVTLNGYFGSNNSSTTTYFQYRMNGGSWMNTPSVNRGIVTGAPFNYNLYSLPAGTYEYQAVATNAYGTNYGSIYTFTIGNTNCPAGYHLSGTTCVQDVQTCPAGYYLSGNTCIQNIQSCPAGYYLSGSTCIQNVQTCPAGYYYSGYTCVQNVQNCPAGYYLSGNTCVQNVQNCPAGYYFSGNTCIQNVQNCPVGYYLSGNTCVQNVQQQTGIPTVSTLGTISVGATAAAIDGYYTSNGCAASTSFNYGTTQALGNRTGEVSRGTGSGSMAQSLTGLAANTTYYYQAFARNCVGTAVGSIQHFTTGTDRTNDTTIVRYVNVNTGGGAGGNSFIKLMIDNHRDTVHSGTEIPYDVSWENLTGRTLNKLVLEINFPTQMSVTDTDHGSVERNKNAVVYQIDTLAGHGTGSMVVTTQITGNLRDNDPVVAQAIMAFENPTTSATENAIAYDADQFSSTGSVLGASLFGLNFLPNSLIGWLIILLILLVIIILAHSYITRSRATTMVVNNHTPGNVQNIPMEPMAQAGAPGNDYVVYRPTAPKQ